jgi:hypothetical protein
MADLDVDFESIYQDNLTETTMTELQAINLLATLTENYSNVYAIVAACGSPKLQDNYVDWGHYHVKAVRRGRGKGFIYAFDNNIVLRQVMLQELMKLSGRFHIVTKTKGI